VIGSIERLIGPHVDEAALVDEERALGKNPTVGIQGQQVTPAQGQFDIAHD